MLCSLVSVQAKAQLFDATQPLKFRRVDQTNHQSAFGAVVAQRNDVVNRIAINSLGHCASSVLSCSTFYHSNADEESHRNRVQDADCKKERRRTCPAPCFEYHKSAPRKADFFGTQAARVPIVLLWSPP